MQNMKLFLFILVALAIILEEHICLAGRQSCGCQSYYNEPTEPCETTLPEGTTFYFDESGFFKYCSNCRPRHLVSQNGLLSWWKSFVSCVCLRDFSDETSPTPLCYCECHTYA